MIWLSPAIGTEECSVYFEIRQISLQYQGNSPSGVVSGLLGDGTRELWGDVFLGQVEHVQILQVWKENGEVESFAEPIDESLLQQQLLQEVKELLNRIGILRDNRNLPHWMKLNSIESRLSCTLAA